MEVPELKRLAPKERELLVRVTVLCIALIAITSAVHFGLPKEIIVPILTFVRR